MTDLAAILNAVSSAKPKPKRKNEEHGYQTALIDLLEIVLPPDAVVTSIDHANAASAVIALVEGASQASNPSPVKIAAAVWARGDVRAA